MDVLYCRMDVLFQSIDVLSHSIDVLSRSIDVQNIKEIELKQCTGSFTRNALFHLFNAWASKHPES